MSVSASQKRSLLMVCEECHDCGMQSAEEYASMVCDEVIQERKVVAIRSKNVSGRARLHTVCPLHGSDESGPCAKFGHLPGMGKGINQPNSGRRIIVLFRHLVKPLIIFAILGGALWLAGHFFSNITSSFIPKLPGSPVVSQMNSKAVPTPITKIVQR